MLAVNAVAPPLTTPPTLGKAARLASGYPTVATSSKTRARVGAKGWHPPPPFPNHPKGPNQAPEVPKLLSHQPRFLSRFNLPVTARKIAKPLSDRTIERAVSWTKEAGIAVVEAGHGRRRTRSAGVPDPPMPVAGIVTFTCPEEYAVRIANDQPTRVPVLPVAVSVISSVQVPLALSPTSEAI